MATADPLLRAQARILYMRQFLLILSSLVLVVFASADATAQRSKPSGRPAGKGPDTVRLAYKFKPGQTVNYRAIMFDSVYVYDVEPRKLAAERVMVVRYRCDSVVEKGFWLTMTLTDYIAYERFNDLPAVTRQGHPWEDRPVSFLISPQGERLSLILEGFGVEPDGTPTEPPAGVAPGGPMQPLFLPYLAEQQTHVGASRMFDHDLWLFDNAYPPIKWTGSTFRVVSRRLDTLKQKTLEMSLSHVGHVTYTSDGGLVTVAKSNGAGDYYLAPKLGYPIGGSYEAINDLKLTIPPGSDPKEMPGRTIDGRHILKMSYELLDPKEVEQSSR